jgi:hypothetical protein
MELDTELNSAVDTLYGLARDEFTPGRDGLVKQAKAAGDRELATAIGKLRRPTVAAWVVNQLSRRRPDELAALTELGARLRTAHRELDGAALRELSVRRRELLAELQRTARDVAGLAGVTVSDTVGRDLEEMFVAALTEEGSAMALVSGRLSSLKELADAGAGWPVTAPGARPRPTLVRTEPEADTPGSTPVAGGATRAAPTMPGAPDAPAARDASGAPAARDASGAPAARDASGARDTPAASAARDASGARDGEPAPDAPAGPTAAVRRARAELDRARDAEAAAERGHQDAERRYRAAAAEETEAHQLVARLRTELVAAEQAEQSARQRARFARRQREDADRELRERHRKTTLSQDRLTALEP